MKKVLFATTALVASAGIASAEMTLTGSAEMGIVGGDNIDTQFHSDYTLKFVGSGETDNGLTFGMTVEIDDETTDAVNDGVATDNETVFISGDFGTLTLGETDGAFDKAMKEVNLAGASIADDETIHAGFNGNSGLDSDEDNQILRYDYAFGDIGFSLSLEQDNDGAGDDDIYGVGFTWAGDFTGVEVGLGLGYQTQDTQGEIWGISLTGDFGNGFKAGLNYSDYDQDGGTANDWQHVGLGVAYTMDAWTFAANWGEYDFGAGGTDQDGYGLAVNYDLGGGAVVQLGYGGGDSDDTWSLGVAMSF